MFPTDIVSCDPIQTARGSLLWWGVLPQRHQGKKTPRAVAPLDWQLPLSLAGAESGWRGGALVKSHTGYIWLQHRELGPCQGILAGREVHVLQGRLGRQAWHRRSPGVPSAHAVGTGTARGHARSRSWPRGTPGSDELTPLPDKGPRAATPEDGAAALVPVGAALGLAMDALVTLPLPSRSLARPSSLQQAISHGQQDETPQGPSRRVCPAAWLLPHIATLILRYFPAEQTGTRLSREPQETRHSNLPAPAPASPCHPGTALPHAAVRGSLRH